MLGTCFFTSEGLGITPGGQLGLVQASEENDEAAAFADWFRVNWDALKAGATAKDKLADQRPQFRAFVDQRLDALL